MYETWSYQSALPCDDESIRVRLAYAQYCYFFVWICVVVIVGAHTRFVHVFSIHNDFVRLRCLLRLWRCFLYLLFLFFFFRLCAFLTLRIFAIPHILIYLRADWTSKSVRQDKLMCHYYIIYFVRQNFIADTGAGVS